MSPQYHLGGLSAAKKLSRCSGSGVVRKWIVWAKLWEFECVTWIEYVSSVSLTVLLLQIEGHQEAFCPHPHCDYDIHCLLSP